MDRAAEAFVGSGGGAGADRAQAAFYYDGGGDGDGRSIRRQFHAGTR